MERLEFILFWLALVLAGVSSIIYIRNFFVRREENIFIRLGSIAASISFFFLLLLLGIHWFRVGLHPFSGPFTARTFFAFSVIGIFLLIELLYSFKAVKTRFLGMFVMPVAVALMLFAWKSYQVSAEIPPKLKSFRVFIHVSSALIAYGAFTIATFLAIMYLLQEHQLRSKNPSQIWRKFPSLESSDELCFKAVAVGFVFSVILLLTGMLTAQMEWGKMWDWREPRMVLTLIMVIIYGVYLFTWEVMGWRGKKGSFLAIIGYLSAIFTYFVPYILKSMHVWGRGF